MDTDIAYLKEKIDAGATFVITQMFYDVDNFVDWVKKCRAAGIHVPIIPGIMPITNFDRTIKQIRMMQTRLPLDVLKELESVKDDDAAVREIGVRFIVDMCRKILENGVLQLHFYTMNLEKATFMILEKLEMPASMTLKNPLPWRQVFPSPYELTDPSA
jgi:methylenetetrahydrofolate reductase (NADPH)